jgi:sarcosine oxidase subunit gamma
MSEAWSGAFTHRRALHGAGGNGVTLSALPEGHVVLLMTRASAQAPDISGLRQAGPGQWFMVGHAPLSADDFAALVARLPDVAVSDQSHGRVRIVVEGGKAPEMLAKGTAVDLEAMAIGASTTTLVGQLGVHLTKTAAATYELMVLRSFAEALWHDLEVMAAEY